MKNYSAYALEHLKNAGLKITKPRQMIVSLLGKSSKALSPYEMRELLKKEKIRADVVTMYRVLEMLESIGLAHKVLAFNGYVRCSSKVLEEKNNSCHHYVLCSKCHKVDEVEGEDLSKLEKKISKEHGFEIKSHYLEFMGLCATCQRSEPKQK